MIRVDMRRSILRCPGTLALIPPAWATADDCVSCGHSGLVAFFDYLHSIALLGLGCYSFASVHLVCLACGAKSQEFPDWSQLPPFKAEGWS